MHFLFCLKTIATEVRRELVSRNLDGDHKIMKFIENCIKSVDGWRFKKSDPNRILSTAGNSLAAAKSAIPASVDTFPDRVLPYPMHLLLLSQLIKQMQVDDTKTEKQFQEVSESIGQQSEPKYFGYTA